jgi:hypothetical protein
MFTKTSFALAFVSAAASLALVAIVASATPSFAVHVGRSGTPNSAPFTTQGPVKLNTIPATADHGCSLRIAFPQCSEGRGNLD